MSYLDTIKRLEQELSTVEKPAVEVVAEYELNEINEKEPVVESPSRYPDLAPCGRVSCAGCYELWPGGPKLHPPHCSLEWQRWRERWDKVKQ